MTSAVCPNCGIDLMRFEPVQRGDLDMMAHEIKWKGQRVSLWPSGKLFIRAIVGANGRPVSRNGLCEAMGCRDESERVGNLISVHACRIRKAFRQIDPAFNAIETVREVGIRWAA